MSPQLETRQFRLWRRAGPYIRTIVLGLLPVPDLVARRHVRRRAAGLVTCDPWPGANANGLDAAQLAILRLLWLQRQTRRAVRGRHREAATMLARASIETLIVGLYCLHRTDAVAQLQAANVKALQDMLEYLSDENVLPADVLAECILRLNLGQPARGPSTEAMARLVDKATGGSAVIDLYKRFYRPTSNLAIHASGMSLMRHVRADDRLTGRPGRVWTRRSPVRIADAALGLLAAAVAQQKDAPYHDLARYTPRHVERALTPVAVMAAGGVGRFKPGQAIDTIKIIRKVGVYSWSGQAATDPVDVREAYIRDQFAAALHVTTAGIPPGTLDPFLDYVAAKLAREALGT